MTEFENVVFHAGGYIPVSDEIRVELQAGERVFNRWSMAALMDRIVRPWRYPDRNPMPQFVLFPRLYRLMRRFKRTSADEI